MQVSRPVEDVRHKTPLAGEYGVVTRHGNKAHKIFKLDENEDDPHTPDLFLSMKREDTALRLLTERKVPHVPRLIKSGVNIVRGEDGALHPEGIIVMTWCGEPVEGPAKSEEELRVIARTLTEVLVAIHTLGLMHRDIKVENLVRDPTTGAVTLVDFGISRQTAYDPLGLPAPMTAGVACIAHRAPEASFAVCCGREEVSYTPAIDIWSMGSTLLELVTGVDEMPFDSGWDEIRRVAMADVRTQLEKTLSKSGADFIMCCLKVAPSLRPSAKTLLKHPWLTQDDGRGRRESKD